MLRHGYIKVGFQLSVIRQAMDHSPSHSPLTNSLLRITVICIWCWSQSDWTPWSLGIILISLNVFWYLTQTNSSAVAKQLLNCSTVQIFSWLSIERSIVLEAHQPRWRCRLLVNLCLCHEEESGSWFLSFSA